MKNVKLELVGNGNAHALLSAFRQAAKKQGWLPEEIKSVLDDAKSRNYAHLVTTLAAHCEEESD